MTTLIIGDLHFKTSNVVEMKELTDELYLMTKNTKPDFVVVLGDILDRFESIHVVPLTCAVNFLKILSELCKVYLLIGNHDRPNNSVFLTTEHPFNSLKEWGKERIVIVDKPIVDKINNHKFLFIPYVYPGRLHEALKVTLPDLDIKSITAAFAHQEFKNAKLGSQISENGDIWDEKYPLMISGHIHDFDVLQENLIYVGTPIQHTFGDKLDKCILLLSYSNRIKWEKINLNLCKKMIVHLKPNEIESWVQPQKTKCKVIITCAPHEAKILTKSIKIKNLIKNGVKILYKDVPTNYKKIIVDKERLKYGAYLFSNIKDDSMLENIYIELFGRPN